MSSLDEGNSGSLVQAERHELMSIPGRQSLVSRGLHEVEAISQRQVLVDSERALQVLLNEYIRALPCTKINMPFESYLRAINLVVLLTRVQEKDLARLIETGDVEALDQMFRANLRL